MRLFVRRVGHGLFPADDASVEEFEKIPRDRMLRAEVTEPRNIAHHRLFFALCARIGAGIGEDTKWVERAFKIEAGLVDFYEYGGKTYRDLQSISFAKMDQIAFREFFEKCVQIAYERWHIDPASLADLLTPEEAHVEGR